MAICKSADVYVAIQKSAQIFMKHTTLKTPSGEIAFKVLSLKHKIGRFGLKIIDLE